MILDHIGLCVSNYKRSKAFYIKVLAPLGHKLLMEVQGFGLKGGGRPVASFWMHEDKAKAGSGLHVGFQAK